MFEVIDAQVHLFSGVPATVPLAKADAEDMIAAMSVADVDGALLVNRTVLGPDSPTELEAVTKYPDRFRVVAGADVLRPDLDDRVRALRADPRVVAVRAGVFSPPQIELWNRGAYTPLFAAAAKSDLPICVLLPGRLAELVPLVRAFPTLQVVIDHLGLEFGPDIADPFTGLPALLRLADFPSVAVKATGMAALSRAAFPYPDLQAPLRTIISAFGVDRVMWGTDWTRVPRATYRQATDFVRDSTVLSASEKEALMGQTLRRVFRWPRKGAA